MPPGEHRRIAQVHGSQQFLEQHVPLGELLRFEDTRQAGAELTLQCLHFRGWRLPRQPPPAEMETLQREFRAGLARILEPEQLAEWNVLLEELLGAVHLRNAPMLAGRH